MPEKKSAIYDMQFLAINEFPKKLPMQSVPITTNVVSSNPTQAKCSWYNIMWWSLSV